MRKLSQFISSPPAKNIRDQNIITVIRECISLHRIFFSNATVTCFKSKRTKDIKKNKIHVHLLLLKELKEKCFSEKMLQNLEQTSETRDCITHDVLKGNPSNSSFA